MALDDPPRPPASRGPVLARLSERDRELPYRLPRCERRDDAEGLSHPYLGRPAQNHLPKQQPLTRQAGTHAGLIHQSLQSSSRDAASPDPAIGTSSNASPDDTTCGRRGNPDRGTADWNRVRN